MVITASDIASAMGEYPEYYHLEIMGFCYVPATREWFVKHWEPTGQKGKYLIQFVPLPHNELQNLIRDCEDCDGEQEMVFIGECDVNGQKAKILNRVIID